MQPLADRMRPTKLSEVAGQRHLLGENGLLVRILESGVLPNMVFYGPPGIGKTTVADILARHAGKTLVRITPAGERARKANEQAMNDYFARIMARLTPDQLAQANAVKDALLAAIEAENAAMKTDLKGEPPHDENF